jgi:tetratricopeptide (TPR) repeat protein
VIQKAEDRRGRLSQQTGGGGLGAGEVVAAGRAAGGFRAWWRSRNFRYLLQGLPALLASLGVAALALHIVLASPEQLVGRYRHEAQRALKAGDHPTAEKCYERLAILKGDDPEVRYGLAMVAEAQGRPERARALIEPLAPLDRPGYAPAHLWQAKRLLAKADASPQDFRDAEVHLRRALQGQPNEVEAHARLGQLYLAGGRLDQAEPYLLRAVEAMPEMRLPLAQLYQAKGKEDLARRQAEQAAWFFRRQAEADVDNHQARLNWAAATLIREDFAGAVDILQPGLAMPQSRPYREALARVYAAWSDAAGRDPDKAARSERLNLLEQGLRYDPIHPALLQRVLALTRTPGAEAQKAQAILDRLLGQNESAAAVHALLGEDAWRRGRVNEARRHHEEAYRLAPQDEVAANNLAWMLAHSQPTDLPRALALINSVLERRPNHPSFRDTQQKILAKMRAAVDEPGVGAVGTEALAPEVLNQAGAPARVEELDRAVASFQRHDYEQALELLNTARQQQPALPPARLMLARLFLADNQLSLGRTHLEQAHVENPDYPGVYLSLGTLALAEERRTDATVHFERAAALARSGPWAEAQRRFFLIQSHAGRVVAAEGRKDWLGARTALTAWLEVEPKNGKVRQRLARTLLELNQPADALKELEQAARDDPALPPAAVGLAWLYARKGDQKKAAEYMESALNSAPDNPRVRLALAGWLLEQGKAGPAQEHADAAARLGLDSKELQLLRGLIARHLKDPAQAEGHFQAVWQQSPEDFQASNQLALALAEQADRSKQRRALQLAEANVRVYPRSPEALATLGRVYHRLGRLEEAEKALTDAAAKGPVTPETAYYLACVLAVRGRAEAAQRLLKPVLDVSANFLFREEAKELYDRLSKKP